MQPVKYWDWLLFLFLCLFLCSLTTCKESVGSGGDVFEAGPWSEVKECAISRRARSPGSVRTCKERYATRPPFPSRASIQAPVVFAHRRRTQRAVPPSPSSSPPRTIAPSFPQASLSIPPFQNYHWPFVLHLFSFDKNSTTVVRQISLNTLIVTVTAEDPNSGLNSRIRYSLIREEPPI